MQKGEGEERSVQLPVGSYRISVRDGIEVGTGEITVDQNGVTTLAHGDLAWSGTTTQPARGAKGAADAAPAASAPVAASASPAIAGQIQAAQQQSTRRWEARVGAHSGYAREGHWGPMVAFGTTWELPLSSRWRWQYGGELTAHQNRAREKYTFSAEYTGARSDVTTTTSALLAVAGLAYRVPFGGAALVTGLDVGYGQGYHEQRRSKSAASATAMTPARAIGFAVALETSPDHRIGIALRRDTMDTHDVSYGESQANGMAVALTTRF
jgi:hypothetical protein